MLVLIGFPGRDVFCSVICICSSSTPRPLRYVKSRSWRLELACIATWCLWFLHSTGRRMVKYWHKRSNWQSASRHSMYRYREQHVVMRYYDVLMISETCHCQYV